MITAQALDQGGVPAPIRRVVWRIWMIARIPVRMVLYPLFGLLWLGIMAGLLWWGATFIFAGGYLVGGIIGLFVDGANAPESFGQIGGTVVLVLAALFGGASWVSDFVADIRNKKPLRQRAARWVLSGIRKYREEWATAEDAWPSRRHALRLQRTAQRLPAPITPAPFATTPAPSPTVEVAAEPIVAWRVWHIRAAPEYGSGPFLSSVTAAAVWESNTLEAQCWPVGLAASGDHDRVPSIDCTCGIYAIKNRTPPSYVSQDQPIARGELELTGRVLEGRRGYRAERATIRGPIVVVLRCERGGFCQGPVVVGAESDGGYDTACDGHREGLVEPLIEDFPLWLQSRLELRYGVEVRIEQQA